MIDFRLSVVVTTYFRNDMLSECLQSLAEQTVQLHEVVVVDDGGDGSARAIVDRFGNRFRYIWQRNSGMQNARNNGVRSSTGNWVAFLDDDDLWLPNRTALLTDVVTDDRVNIVSGDFLKFSADGTSSISVFSEISEQSPSFWDGITRNPVEGYSVVGSFPTTRLLPVHPFWPSTLVVRRDLFDQLHGWNEMMNRVKAEDIEFVFRALRVGHLALIFVPTVHYRTHAGNDAGSTLSVALGRIHVWESLASSSETTESERSALCSMIRRSLHQVLYSAFSEGRYPIAVSISKRLGWSELTLTEKLKTLISVSLAQLQWATKCGGPS